MDKVELSPYLETAMTIYSALKRTEVERDIYRNLTGRLGIGSVVLDQAGKVIHVNDTASQTMQTGRISMVMSGQKIHFQRRSLNEEFQRVLAAALAGEYGMMKVPAGGQMDVGLLIRPMPPAMEYTGESLPRILVYFSDPLADKLVPPALIAKLFGLALAEASLALQLAEGLSLAAAAQKAGISESSARNQHLVLTRRIQLKVFNRERRMGGTQYRRLNLHGQVSFYLMSLRRNVSAGWGCGNPQMGGIPPGASSLAMAVAGESPSLGTWFLK